MRSALTIAGSDPTGGAGLQADLQVFRSHGLHGAGVTTALTLQDSAKIHKVMPVFPSLVLEQLRVLLRDFIPTALKVGMLYSDDIVLNVTRALGALDEQTPVVVDPLLAASDGTPLLERRAWGSLQRLMQGCRLATPNLIEAEQLTGTDVSTRVGCERAARVFLDDFGCRAVLVKGGHREGAPDDLLAERSVDGATFAWLSGTRLEGAPVHGTGCALSAAITAGLALGQDLAEAVEAARHFVRDAIESARAPGAGARFLVLPGQVL
ncbi:MAG: bifunctional hydroxymethylpyrimidine kinase/phosphomethylpyrimidine kinase [Deltaproteobacteria bacterium]|nr:bifunctional hydroxymethylpyrimidine kinase/phosphomethylpyrimidine kinase [Deltaproteobacteria bacterium]